MPLRIALAALLFASGAAHGDSFNAVRTRVYANPLKKLPEHPGMSMSEFAKAFMGLKEPIGVRSQQTISLGSDFKPRAAKLLHPRGVCAEGLWVIREDLGATGLLAKGTSIPAIIRFSAATKDSRYLKSQKRVFGMAVKLFPTKDGSKAVVTRNIFTLDQGGLEGTSRVTYFGQKADGLVYFHNFAPGKGVGSRIANEFFSRFDKPADVRPLWPLTEIDQRGAKVAAPKTPREIRFIPQRKAGVLEMADDDFRDEILQYKPGDLSMAIGLQDASGAWKQVGALYVGQPVVTAACDLELTFHHHPHDRSKERP